MTDAAAGPQAEVPEALDPATAPAQRPRAARRRRKAKPKKRGPWRQASKPELALAICYAEENGPHSAAKRFKLSAKTIRKWRKVAESGEDPELAQLVAAQRERALAHCRDLLTEVYEHALRRLDEVLPEAEARDVIDAIKMLGELKVTREVLNAEVPEQSAAEQAEEQPESDGEQPSTDRQSPFHAAHGGGGPLIPSPRPKPAPSIHAVQ